MKEVDIWSDVAQATAECSTELWMEKIQHLEEIAKDYSELQNEYIILIENLNITSINIDLFKEEKKILFYTGFCNSKILKVIIGFCCSPNK